MPSLRIFTFGSPHFDIKGKALDVRRRKGSALLTYLAVTGQPHTREALATMFWPENDQSSALANLRRELSRLNQALGEGVLAIDRLQASVNPQVDAWVDAAAFRSSLQAFRDEGHAPKDECEECFQRLTEAVELYREDFLAGFNLPDSPAFDEWQFFQAEDLRQGLAEALQWLIGWHVQRGEYSQGVENARRWVALDNLHEPAQRQLMQLYAWDNQQAAALRQYQECVRLLKEELDLEPNSETTTLYEAIRARQLPAHAEQERATEEDYPETAPTDPRPVVRLPAQATGFVGREEELTEICRLLETKANCRLLTLLGPGGIGKTRLAVQAALDIAAHPEAIFPDGVWFVSLAQLNSPEQILPAIAGALDFATYTDRQQQRQALFNYLNDKQLLLVLDNFEHLIAPESVGLVRELLAGAPGVKVLTTSRARLNLREEQLYLVEGLDAPPLAGSVGELEVRPDLAAYSAIQLFRQCALRVIPDFELDGETLPAVQRICQMVRGMPLGIELAAGWLEALLLDEIANEIERSLDFLQTELYDVPERQRSLRAVFESSWRLLSDQEQKTLLSLAVFQGSFTREAVQALSGATLPILLALVNKSWLGREENGRFRIHELLRQYAVEVLQSDRSAWEAAKDRHSDYYAKRCTALAAKMRSPQQREAYAEVGDEFANLRAAWDWLVERRRLAALAQGLLPAIFWYCEAKARISNLLELLATARNAIEETGFPTESPAIRATLQTAQAAIFRNGYPVRLESYGLFLPAHEEAIQEAWSLAEDDAVTQEMGIWASLMAYIYGRVIDPEASAERLRQLAAAAREKGMRWELAENLFYLSCILQVLYVNNLDGEQLAEAADCLDEAHSIFTSLGDEREHAIVLNAMGQQRMLEGKLREAIETWSNSQAQLQSMGDRAMSIDTNWQVGDTYIRLGEFESAFEAFHAVSKFYLDRGQKRLAAQSLAKESLETSRYGQLTRARELRAQSLSLYQEVGDVYGQAWSTWEMGEIQRLAGDVQAAKKWYVEARTHFDRFAQSGGTGDYQSGAIFYRRGLGDLALVNGDPVEAEAHFQDSLKYARAENHEWAAAYALCGLGQAALLAGKPELARDLFRQALQTGRKTGDRGVSMVGLAGMARVYAETGELERAVELASLVAEHYASWGETKAQASATLALALQNLPEELAAAAQERGARLDLWGTVEGLLG